MPIIQIALMCGYDSQRAFSLAIKSMYKLHLRAFDEVGRFIRYSFVGRYLQML
jgi:AraC-like DNA-binding protein